MVKNRKKTMQVPFLSLKDITAKYADELHEAVLRVTDQAGICRAMKTRSLRKITQNISAQSIVLELRMDFRLWSL